MEEVDKKNFFLTVFLLIIAICVLYYSMIVFFYQTAIKKIEQDKLTEAVEYFLLVPYFYKDAEVLSLYAKYNELEFETSGEYYDVIKKFNEGELGYDIKYQSSIDGLLERLRDDAGDLHSKERQEREKYLIEKYGNDLPYEGMDADALRYTSLGNPDSSSKAASWWGTIYTWYTKEEDILASCRVLHGRVEGFSWHGYEYGYDKYGNK